jgi:hypothetical protein
LMFMGECKCKDLMVDDYSRQSRRRVQVRPRDSVIRWAKT